MNDEAADLYFKEQIDLQVSPRRLRWSFVLLVEHCNWMAAELTQYEEHLIKDYIMDPLLGPREGAQSAPSRYPTTIKTLWEIAERYWHQRSNH